jgi:hypothetical protein
MRYLVAEGSGVRLSGVEWENTRSAAFKQREADNRPHGGTVNATCLLQWGANNEH